MRASIVSSAAALLVLSYALAWAQYGPGAAPASAAASPNVTWYSYHQSAPGVADFLAFTGPGKLTTYKVCANLTEPLYLRMYDTATTPDGTATPVWRDTIPSGSCASQPSATTFQISFTQGLGLSISPLLPDTDQSAVGANEITANFGAVQ